MKVFTTRPFTYMGQDLDRGEIIDLRNSPRDNQLLGLRYFLPYDSKIYDTKSCAMCGRKFAGEGHLLEHKRKPSCVADTQEISKTELAMSLDMDASRVSMPE